MKCLVVILLVVVLLAGCTVLGREYAVYDSNGKCILDVAEESRGDHATVDFESYEVYNGKKNKVDKLLRNTGALYTARGITIGSSLKEFIKAYKGMDALYEDGESCIIGNNDEFLEEYMWDGFGDVVIGTRTYAKELAGGYAGNYLRRHCTEAYAITFIFEDGEVENIVIDYYDYTDCEPFRETVEKASPSYPKNQ